MSREASVLCLSSVPPAGSSSVVFSLSDSEQAAAALNTFNRSSVLQIQRNFALDTQSSSSKCLLGGAANRRNAVMSSD